MFRENTLVFYIFTKIIKSPVNKKYFTANSVGPAKEMPPQTLTLVLIFFVHGIRSGSEHFSRS